MKHLVFSLCLLIFFSTPVFAQSVVTHAGPPNLFGSSPFGSESAYNFSDIYARKLEYADERQRFKTSIEARRQDFATPRQQAFQGYQQSLNGFKQTRKDFVRLNQ